MTDWLKNTPIAHRGLHDLTKGVPENSLLSFKKAMEHGYAIEIDLRLTKDHRVVVFHDVDLKRICGSDKRIDSSTYNELNEFYLSETKEKIPTLEEVLDLVQGEVPLLIEIKSYIFTGEIEELTYKLLQNYSGPFAIQCFNPWCVKWFKDNAPHIQRGLLAGRMKDIELHISKKLILRSLILSHIVKADFLSLEYDAYPPIYAQIIKKFSKAQNILFWTIKDKDKAHRLRSEFGLNYIFEDFLPLG